jgi:HlyD family secretion protein
MKTLSRRVGLAMVLAALGVGGYALWLATRPPELPPGFASGNGRVEGTEVDVATKFAGRVTELLVREGDAVKAGQVIARLDDRALRAQLAAARAAAERARHEDHAAETEVERRRHELTFAQAEYDRSVRLFERGAVPESRLDRDRAAWQTAEAVLRAAAAREAEAHAQLVTSEAQIDEIEANLSDFTIAAPVPGRVLFRLAEPGEVLPAGGKIATIVDLDDLYMTVYLPERIAGRVRIGADAHIRVDAFPERLLPARVTFVAPSAEFTPKEVQTTEERQKLVFRTRLEPTANPDYILKPGMPGEGFIRLDPDAPWPETLP